MRGINILKCGKIEMPEVVLEDEKPTELTGEDEIIPEEDLIVNDVQNEDPMVGTILEVTGE